MQKKTGKEQEENILRRERYFLQMRRRKEKERRKIFFCEGEEEWRGKRKRIFGEGNYLGARILDLGGPP